MNVYEVQGHQTHKHQGLEIITGHRLNGGLKTEGLLMGTICLLLHPYSLEQTFHATRQRPVERFMWNNVYIKKALGGLIYGATLPDLIPN